MTKVRLTKVVSRSNSGRKDLLIIVFIGLVIVAASIFFILRIIGHSEKHLETVKKTKFAYKENLTWRPDSKESNSRIESDFANNLTQTKADYGGLNISKRSFELIGKMPKLESLKLTRAIFDEHHLIYLRNSPINYIGLHGTTITDKCIPTLLDLKNLWSLEIGDSELTDKGLAKLATSKRLKHLEINLPRRITEDGVKHIAKMKQLEQLELAYPKNFTGKCLNYLTGLKNIFYLNLESMPVKPEDLQNLTAFKNLSILDLSNSNLTDDDIAQVGKLTTLRVLNLNGSSFTDQGLMKLQNLKNLERLSIKHCPNITEPAVKKLQAALASCKISYSRSSGWAEKLKREEVRGELDFLKNEAKNELKKRD